jgi:hypothetical protein
MMAVFMEAAQAAGVDDRVISYHASLGVPEWRFPSPLRQGKCRLVPSAPPPDNFRSCSAGLPSPSRH